MKIKGHRPYLCNLESIALTDIVLNMFIFFFISFSLLYTFDPQRLQRIEVNLPKAQSGSPMDERSRFYITLDAKGDIYVKTDLVSINDLKSRLSATFEENKDLNVIVRVDKNTVFDRVTQVLDTINLVGVKKISVAVSKK